MKKITTLTDICFEQSNLQALYNSLLPDFTSLEMVIRGLSDNAITCHVQTAGITQEIHLVSVFFPVEGCGTGAAPLADTMVVLGDKWIGNTDSRYQMGVKIARTNYHTTHRVISCALSQSIGLSHTLTEYVAKPIKRINSKRQVEGCAPIPVVFDVSIK